MTRSKYRAKPVVIDGIRFDSQAEGRRYRDLMLLWKAGGISKPDVHVRYKIEVKGIHITTYESDFEYHDKLKHIDVVEDVKGVRTEAYKIKKKLMLAVHGIEIKEVQA